MTLSEAAVDAQILSFFDNQCIIKIKGFRNTNPIRSEFPVREWKVIQNVISKIAAK